MRNSTSRAISERELVVAHYDEKLRWLNRVPPGFGVRVYTKGADASRGIPLPNRGREAQTYLHHVVQHYDGLPGLLVFAQGAPFDHVPDLVRILGLIDGEIIDVDGFMGMGLFADYDDVEGQRLFRAWSKNDDGRGLDMARFWRAAVGGVVPDTFPFFTGATFAVTSEQVRQRPLADYERMLDVAEVLPDAAHCFERAWPEVFGAVNVLRTLPLADFPMHFRPVRRLGTTWETVDRLPGHPYYARSAADWGNDR